MKICSFGFHGWSVWSMPKKGYEGFVQFRVCKNCGKQKYRTEYNEQVNVEKEFYENAIKGNINEK